MNIGNKLYCKKNKKGYFVKGNWYKVSTVRFMGSVEPDKFKLKGINFYIDKKKE